MANDHPEQDPAEESRPVIEKELKRKDRKSAGENDAAGQFVQSRHGEMNDGVTNAQPRIFDNKDGNAVNRKPNKD